MTKELIEEVRSIVKDLYEIVFIHIVEIILLVQPQVGSRPNGIVKLEPDNITWVVKDAIGFRRTRCSSSSRRIVNATEGINAVGKA